MGAVNVHQVEHLVKGRKIKTCGITLKWNDPDTLRPVFKNMPALPQGDKSLVVSLNVQGGRIAGGQIQCINFQMWKVGRQSECRNAGEGPDFKSLLYIERLGQRGEKIKALNALCPILKKGAGRQRYFDCAELFQK